VRIASPGRPGWAVGLRVLALALFDEITQELPGLNRSFDPIDLVADAGGVALALAWCRVLGPTRRGPSWWHDAHRSRIAGHRLLLASFANWVHIGVAGVLGAMIGGVLLTLLVRHPVIGPITMTVVGAETGLVAGVVAALEIGRRHAARRLADERRCLGCLMPGTTPGVPCGTCGETSGGDVGAGSADRRVGRRRLLVPAVVSLVISAGLLALGYLGLQSLRWRMVRPWPWLQWYDRLPVADAMAFDAIILGLVGAATVWWIRQAGARLAEREGIRCLRCGHDLRGTPDDAGEGCCPECGARFLRAFADTGASGEHASR
jgi:hypothetical protein